MRRAEISFESEPFQFAAARQMSKSQAGRKTSLGAFSLCLGSCDAPLWKCKELQSLLKLGLYFIFTHFFHFSFLLLHFDLMWRNKECFLSPCFVYRKDYVSDQSKHENYKHSPSSLGCRPDITGLDSLECLVVHLAKGRSRRAAVQGSNSLWSSASECVCVCVWVCVCVCARNAISQPKYTSWSTLKFQGNHGAPRLVESVCMYVCMCVCMCVITCGIRLDALLRPPFGFDF